MTEIHGNIEGIRKSVLEELCQWYGEEVPTDVFLPQNLLKRLCACSAMLNREMAVYISRDGEIADILIGWANRIDLPEAVLRSRRRRLCMIRCIHTHPGNEGLLSEVDISALINTRFDAICAVGVDAEGRPTSAQAAFLDPEQEGAARKTPMVPALLIPGADWIREILETDARYKAENSATDKTAEQAVLVGIDSEKSLLELRELARTAGAETIATVLQKRAKPDSTYFIGRGKAEELALQCQALRADLVIADDELTGVMQKSLEELLRLKVVDRTTLIMDIFASRANTREGKLQVEMAQLQYRSQRLLGQGLVLSRLAGGIGTRGPGESKLEVNRRRIRERLADLKQELEQIERQRGLRRNRREKTQCPLIALVGYTNAGKSTLFNLLTGSDVYVKDELFATLDSVSRPITLPHGGKALVVDTVGFIRKLPHDLVKAFHATLEEAALADVNVIVSDGTSPELFTQHATVLEVLDSLNATSAQRVDVLNKCDLRVGPEESFPGAVTLSARTGEGVERLLQRLEDLLEGGLQTVKLLIPFKNYGLLSRLHGYGSILSREHGEDGVVVALRAKPRYIKIACKEGAALLSDEKNS